jgi:hypothetical protein
MSIYATLWALQFPRFGDFHIGCEWVTVIGVWSMRRFRFPPCMLDSVTLCEATGRI